MEYVSLFLQTIVQSKMLCNVKSQHFMLIALPAVLITALYSISKKKYLLLILVSKTLAKR